MKTFLADDEIMLSAVSNDILKESTHKIFLLTGDLGAGKTTFTKAILSHLNCLDKVSSPTFSLINEYHGKDSIFYHIDLYRINSMHEAMDFGIEDYLYSDNYCFIEWPQVIQSIIPKQHHTLDFHILEGDKRKIIFS